MINSKITLSILLFTISFFAGGCQNVSAKGSTSFSDIEGHWAESTIIKAISSGYVDGYPDGSFQPDESISRAEFIKMVATATGTKPSTTQGTNWYQSYVDSLKQQKVLRDSDFSDYNGVLTRLELTKLAVREIRDDVKNPDAVLSDAGYFYDAVKVGLVQGLAGGELGMDQPTTRAQSLTIIERIKALKGGEKLEVDKNALNLSEIALNGTNMSAVLGTKPAITFPFDASWSEDIKFTVNKLIVIDCDNPDDPNKGLLDGVVRFDEKLFVDCYVFAYDVSLDVLKEGSKGKLRTDNYFYMGPWVPAYGNGVLRAFDMSHVGKTNGYLFFVAPSKEMVDKLLVDKKAEFYIDYNSKSLRINKY